MKALLALIKKLYGSKAIQKTIGTRTNVISLPDKNTRRFVEGELNIDAASDAAIEKAYKDVEKLIPDIPKMNDQEILTFTGNLRRLDNRINPPSAEIVDIGTKQPVSPTGIKQLEAEQGLPKDVDPDSLMGRLLTSVNKLKAESKKMQTSQEDTLKDLLTKGPGSYDWQREGIVRTGAREILEKNLKSGKLKLKDPYEEKMIKEFRQGGVDPIEVFRREYGEGALEKLDDIADDLLPAQSYKEINDILNKNKLFDLKPISAEQKATEKASSEAAEKLMKDVKEGKVKTLQQAYEEGELKGTGLDDLMDSFDGPDEFATGGRVGFSGGKLVGKGIKALAKKIKKPKKVKEEITFKKDLEGITDKEIEKSYKEAFEGNDLDLSDNKYDAQIIADYVANNRYKTDFYDLPQDVQIDLYDKSYTWLMNDKMEKAQQYKNIKIFDDKEASAFTQFIKETDPEGYKRIEKIVDDINNKNTLENFDPTGRKKNATGGRVEMASGGIAALKALIKFMGAQRGKKGSEMLKEINPKRMRHLQFLMKKSDREMLDANRQEYLENLSDIIKSDKKLLDSIKEMPEETRDTFFRMANEGGNRGRLDVYRNPDFNIDDAIGEIEQMKKNLKFKDVPEEEVKRQLNAGGGVAYLMGL